MSPREEKMEKRNYECMMIVSSAVTEEKRGELVKKFSKMASPSTTVEKLGLRKFSVPINYREQGFYVLLHFEASPEVVAEMTKVMNITDGVERFIFIAKDEKMLAADVERKAKRLEAKAKRDAKESEVKE